MLPQYSANGEDWEPIGNDEIARLIENLNARGWLRFPACSPHRFALVSARVAWKLGKAGEPLAVVLLKMLPGGE